MTNAIQDFTGAVITYKVATGSLSNYQKKIFKTSYDEMLKKMKEPNVRSISIMKVKMPASSSAPTT